MIKQYNLKNLNLSEVTKREIEKKFDCSISRNTKGWWTITIDDNQFVPCAHEINRLKSQSSMRYA